MAHAVLFFFSERPAQKTFLNEFQINISVHLEIDSATNVQITQLSPAARFNLFQLFHNLPQQANV